MKFSISLDEIIDSRAKIKLLKHLFAQDVYMSERELSRVLKVSHMTINRLMKELYALNLVSLERVGNVNLWTVNKRSYAYHILSQVIKGISDRRLKPLEDLKNTILNNLPTSMIQKAILFGSIASGTEKPNSDIDLFILVKSSQDKNKVEPLVHKLSHLCLDLYGNRLSPYILTQSQLKKRKKLPLVSEIEKGIQIYPPKERV